MRRLRIPPADVHAAPAMKDAAPRKVGAPRTTAARDRLEADAKTRA